MKFGSVSLIVLTLCTGIGLVSAQENVVVPSSPDLKCGRSIGKLKVCSVSHISFSENGPMIFIYSTVNSGDRELNLPSLCTEIYDRKNNRVPTVYENKNDPHGFIYQAFISHRFPRIVKARQKRDWKKILGRLYDLKKGTYSLQVTTRFRGGDQSKFSDVTLLKVKIKVKAAKKIIND